jgi:hypothetical protein
LKELRRLIELVSAAETGSWPVRDGLVSRIADDAEDFIKSKQNSTIFSK